MVKVAKIYSREGCGACVSAKVFMDNKGLPYEIIDVGIDKDAMKELRQLGVMSLPLIKIGEENIIGFNPVLIIEAFK